jgi:hypothetical protein
MAKTSNTKAVTDEVIVSRIYTIRGQKVMLDEDLAELYQVSTGRLNEQVKRNIDRFPVDFMFQLKEDEFKILKSQFATSSWGGRRKLPAAFTINGRRRSSPTHWEILPFLKRRSKTMIGMITGRGDRRGIRVPAALRARSRG